MTDDEKYRRFHDLRDRLQDLVHTHDRKDMYFRWLLFIPGAVITLGVVYGVAWVLVWAEQPVDRAGWLVWLIGLPLGVLAAWRFLKGVRNLHKAAIAFTKEFDREFPQGSWERRFGLWLLHHWPHPDQRWAGAWLYQVRGYTAFEYYRLGFDLAYHLAHPEPAASEGVSQ